MTKPTWEDLKEAVVPMALIFGAVCAFGFVVEHLTDVDENWDDYIKDISRKRKKTT